MRRERVPFFAMMAGGVKGGWSEVGLMLVVVNLLLVLKCMPRRRRAENALAAIRTEGTLGITSRKRYPR